MSDMPAPNSFDDMPPDVQIAELKDRIAALEATIKRVERENRGLREALKDEVRDEMKAALAEQETPE